MKQQVLLNEFYFDHEKKTLYLDGVKIKGLKHYEIKSGLDGTEELTLKLDVIAARNAPE